MNNQRVVMVFAETAVGSGYLLGPTLVLTAKHVVANRSAVEVWSNAARQYGWANIAWCSSDELDACLLKLERPLDAELGPAPVAAAFGRSQAVDWECTGFPDAAAISRNEAALREAVGASGLIATGGGDTRRMLDLTVEGGWPTTAHGWQGLSGAVVVAQGCVERARLRVGHEV